MCQLLSRLPLSVALNTLGKMVSICLNLSGGLQTYVNKTFEKKMGKNKGHTISKGLLVSSNSPKKQTNGFVFTTTNLFVRFLGELEDTKSPFEII